MERPRGRIARPVKPRKAAKWTKSPFHARPEGPQLERWSRALSTTEQNGVPSRNYDRYNIDLAVPEYDEEKYEKHLTHAEWTKEETDYLIELYRECNAKWPVIIDRYEFGGPERTMEDLKARFYSVTATLLQLATPITSMTATDYSLYEMLTTFNPAQETSRKKLAEGHLYRRANEVDEETVLLGELQRIMLNQATLDTQREELRTRLDYPLNTAGGQQYTTFQQLTQLWQHLLFQDRQRKQPRMRPTGKSACYSHYEANVLNRQSQSRWLPHHDTYIRASTRFYRWSIRCHRIPSQPTSYPRLPPLCELAKRSSRRPLQSRSAALRRRRAARRQAPEWCLLRE